MNFNLPLLAYFVLYVNDAVGQSAVEQTGCKTVFSGSGSCVGIYDCELIVTFMKNAAKPISSATSDLLRRYQCEHEQNSIKVCCPANSSEIARLQETTSIGSDSSTSDSNPPDISSHANLRLLPKDCGNIVENKLVILNGLKASLSEFPWMALLSYKLAGAKRFLCGGTIINDRYILTAAHCLIPPKYKIEGVRVGEHDLRTEIDCHTADEKSCAPPVQDVGIERTIVHPLYDRLSYIYDIGLIRLAKPVNFTDSVAPICLPVTQETANYNFTNRPSIVIGFGITEKGIKSPTLQKVELPHIELNECKKVYKKSAPISYRQLCAGGHNKKDSCKGDSGGPLQIVNQLNGSFRFVQHGITSFGPRDCGAEGNPGVYTKVAYYMDWILDNIS